MTELLYKYLRREHADSFFARGTIRIGTLQEFRRVEEHGNAVGDVDEGQHHTVFSFQGGGNIDLSEDSPAAEYIRKQILGIGDKRANVTMALHQDTRIIHRGQSKNYYIYCLTAHFNEASMREFGYNSAIVVHQPEDFLIAISRRIRHRGTPVYFGPVVYKDKITGWNKPHDVHPALLKSPNYAYQHEWRALWDPIGSNSRPIFVNVPEAIRYCARHVT